MSAKDDTAITAAPTLAVVSSTNPIALWHVELSPAFSSSRLSGAWLIDPLADDASSRLINLLSNCAVAYAEDALPAENNESGAATSKSADSTRDVIEKARETVGATVIDLNKTVSEIGAHMKQLRAQVKEEKAKPGKSNLTAPRFPTISAFEPIEFPHTGEEVAADALAVARGVEKLVSQWGELESQRLRRKYLAEPWGEQARQIPLATK